MTVFEPVVLYEVLKLEPEPVAGLPPPLHVYEPVPPDALKLALAFGATVCEAGEHVGAPPLVLNVAVTERACVMDTTQLPVPEHAPLHPANVEPAAAD